MTTNKVTTSQLKKVKLVITDVDGVLTDGGLYYTSEGLIMKRFNVKDGMGMRLLRENKIKTAIITTDTSELIKLRARRIKADYIYLGVWDKENKLLEICALENIDPINVAFIGDDVNDIGIINEAGISACPSDAVPHIQNLVNIILSKKGGEGVFREFADLILNANN